MNEREIFTAARYIADQMSRQEFVEEVCAGDLQLRDRVLELLHSSEAAESFLESPAEALAEMAAELEQFPGPSAAEVLPTISGTPADSPDVEQQIGVYKLIEQIGQGGMGTVYMAEQKQPVRRMVALKVIKPGMDSAQVVGRFEAERQALALMNHPNIAKVLDAGATESGRPFFVMELVRGIPVTHYCDQHRFDVGQRLELFTTICHAVQHAHQKGVIHRDLKPSNILVELHDVRAVPKVIDFGVAKATCQQLTSRTLHTGLTQMIGTPTYMSPEQAQLSGLDVDTRSDIYSLGVLLYELLTGTTPFESETLRAVGFDEMRRLIREEEPPRPSDRVTTLAAEALSTVSARRQSEPHRLKRRLAGELDWIVMKALEKDRSLRYESASALASDVQRFLGNEPVVACPPSPAYKLRKFVRRNKAAFTTAILVALALLLGIAGTGWQAVVATQARQQADEQRDQAQQQRDVAEENFRRAREAVDSYLTRVSEDQLLNAPGMQSLRKDLLELALKYYEQFVDERASDASLQAEFAAALDRVADIRSSLGDKPAADKLHQQALDVRLRLVADNPRDEDLLHSLAESYISVSYGESKFKGRIDRLKKAVEVAEPLRKPEHQVTLACALRELGAALRDHFRNDGGLGRMDASRKAFERAIQILEDRQNWYLDQPSDLLPGAYSRLASWHSTMGQPKEARQLHQKALTIAEQLAAADPNNIRLQESLQSRYWNVGQYEKSVRVTEKLARENPLVVEYQAYLADSYGRMARIRREQIGKEQEAVEWADKGVAIYARLARDDPDFKFYQGKLGVQQEALGCALHAAGRVDEAITAFEAAIQSLNESGLWRGQLADAHLYLSLALESSGRLGEAIEHQKSAITNSAKLSSEQLHFRSTRAKKIQRLGEMLQKAGKLEEAEVNYRKAVEMLRQLVTNGPGGTPEQVRNCQRWLVGAESAFARCLDKLRRSEPESWLRDGISCWQAAGRRPEASNLCHMQQLRLSVRLVRLLRLSGRTAEASELIGQTQEVLKQLDMEDDEVVLRALVYYAPLLRSSQVAEASGRALEVLKALRGHLPRVLEIARSRVQSPDSSAKAWNDWNQVALTFYQVQNWSGAEVEAELAAELGADRPDLMMRIVPLYLLAGKHDEYRRVCGQLMDRWQEWTGYGLSFAACICTLDPQPPDDPQRLMRLVQRAVDEGPPWTRGYLYRAYCRIGDHQQVIDAKGSAEPSLDLAIALSHLGRTLDARLCLDELVGTWEEYEPPNVMADLEREVLRQEAERLILSENSSTDSKNDHTQQLN